MKVAICLSIACLLGSADWDERHLDLRAEASTLPLGLEQRGSSDLYVGLSHLTGGGSSTLDAESAGRISLLLLGSARNSQHSIGALGGIGLNASEWNYKEDDNGDLTKGTVSTVTMSAHLGLYAPISSYVRIEFLPWIGLGQSRDQYEWSGPSTANWSKTKFNHTGDVFEGGARVSLVASQNRGVQASASIGYLVSRSSILSTDYFTIGGSNATFFQDYSITSKGAFAALSVGIRL